MLGVVDAELRYQSMQAAQIFYCMDASEERLTAQERAIQETIVSRFQRARFTVVLTKLDKGEQNLAAKGLMEDLQAAFPDSRIIHSGVGNISEARTMLVPYDQPPLDLDLVADAQASNGHDLPPKEKVDEPTDVTSNGLAQRKNEELPGNNTKGIVRLSRLTSCCPGTSCMWQAPNGAKECVFFRP